MPSSPRLERPVLSVDVVVLTVDDGVLRLLLHERPSPPYAGALALPGVAVRTEESLVAACRRALTSKAGLSEDDAQSLHLEQLATFDALYRDPRGRTVAVAHVGLSGTCLPAATRPGARWLPLRELPSGSLPFDHDEVVETALARLRGKIRYTNIAARLLPEAFRIDELERAYEAILERPLNRSNFRTKLLRIGLIERVGVLADAVGSRGGRPPHLYRFASTDVEAVDRDFL